jgi:hypothetical protein
VACIQFGRKFAGWAETFYIDAALAKKLATEYPPEKHPHARAEHYGLGSARGVRNPLGPSWVLPDILGVQLLLTYADPSPDYRLIAERNVRAYLDAGYSAAGYYHAEAMTGGALKRPVRPSSAKRAPRDVMRPSVRPRRSVTTPEDLHACHEASDGGGMSVARRGQGSFTRKR